jgi:membrane protease YdiL (CAAX protease family)
MLYSAAALAAFYLTALLIARPATDFGLLHNSGVYLVALAVILSFAIFATFRAIEGRFLIPRGKLVYRGATAAILLWLLCFVVCVTALLASVAVSRIHGPLWQPRAPANVSSIISPGTRANRSSYNQLLLTPRAV